MGCNSSLASFENKAVLDEAYALFCESNCVFGSDKCVSMQKLKSAFTFYLVKNNISVKTWWQSDFDVATSYIDSIITKNGLCLVSPGYREFSVDGYRIAIDTRYAVGMDVVRFQK